MEKKKKRGPAARRLVQLYAALLYNANLKGVLQGKLYTGSAKVLCVPGLNCYSCPAAVGACPLGALQNALAASGHTAGWYVMGILLLFGVTLGRTVCGWLCPFGLLQELLYKLPTHKIRKSRITRVLSCGKYLVLAVFVLALPPIYGLAHHIPLPAFCKYICPAGTLEGALTLLLHPDNGGLLAQLGVLFTRKFVILLVILLACIFLYRSFCRFLCPLGALYSFFNRFSIVGVRVDENRCTGCGACVRRCPMDVRRVSDRECIFCGQCVAACGQGALAIKCGKITLKGPDIGTSAASEPLKKRKKAGRVLGGVLLSLLLFAVIYLNCIAVPAPAEPPATDAAPTGWEAGCQLADFTCTLVDGSSFHLADYRGKVVIINQWATYCTPCVGELPYFERLQEENPDVVILAFHHWLEAIPTAAEFLKEKGWNDWQIHFAVDDMDETILQTIGGDNAMPRTVVLNARGEVVYNEQRSVTYDMLLSLLEQAQ